MIPLKTLHVNHKYFSENVSFRQWIFFGILKTFLF